MEAPPNSRSSGKLGKIHSPNPLDRTSPINDLPNMDLGKKIASRSATVGVIGLGYVGLPLLHAFGQAGLPVVGFDVDPRKIDLLRAGTNYLKHLGPTLVSDLLATGRFSATTDIARMADCDAIISCVPT